METVILWISIVGILPFKGCLPVIFIIMVKVMSTMNKGDMQQDTTPQKRRKRLVLLTPLVVAEGRDRGRYTSLLWVTIVVQVKKIAEM